MIELKLNGVYKTNKGFTVTIRQVYFDDADQESTYIGSNSMYYRENGYLFGYPFEDDPDRIISEVIDVAEVGLNVKSTVESVVYSINHSDIQLLRKQLLERLVIVDEFIYDEKYLRNIYYKRSSPDTIDGIDSFHILNRCKKRIKEYSKERKHIAELLRKLKKQQAELLRNNAKV